MSQEGPGKPNVPKVEQATNNIEAETANEEALLEKNAAKILSYDHELNELLGNPGQDFSPERFVRIKDELDSQVAEINQKFMDREYWPVVGGGIGGVLGGPAGIAMGIGAGSAAAVAVWGIQRFKNLLDQAFNDINATKHGVFLDDLDKGKGNA